MQRLEMGGLVLCATRYLAVAGSWVEERYRKDGLESEARVHVSVEREGGKDGDGWRSRCKRMANKSDCPRVESS